MFALAFLLLCSAAHADLYRWVDPESGSVKLSNAPPPWYERGGGPAVEVIPYTARPAAVDPLAPPSAGALQARWREALLAASSQPTSERLQALALLKSELDKVDPAGAPRRQEETSSILRRTQK